MSDERLEQLEKYNKMMEGAGLSKSQRAELLRKFFSEYDKELEAKGLDTYEELAKYYKEVYKETPDYKLMGPDGAKKVFDNIDQKSQPKQTPGYEGKPGTSKELIDTPEELKAEVRELMRQRDFDRVFDQNLRYDNELKANGLDTYKELAGYYKDLYGFLNPDEFPNKGDFERWSKRTDLKRDKDLDTLKELRAEVQGLMAARDNKYVELNLRYDKEFHEEGLDTYEELAVEFKQVWKLVNKGTPYENKYEGKDLEGFKHLDTYGELRKQTMRLMDQYDRQHKVRIEKVEEVKPDASSAIEGAGPFGIELAPIVEGEASSRLMGGGEALPTEDLRDKAFFSGKEEREGAPDAAATGAAPAEAGDADKIETPPDSIERPIIGSFKDLDTQDVQGETPVQNEAQEYQGIGIQEQSMFEAAPQWSVDQDQLLNPYDEDDPTSSKPKDQLLNPYEDDSSSLPEDELLNPYVDEEGAIPKDQLLNPYEDDPSPIPKDELLNPYEDDPSSIPEDQLLNPYDEEDAVIDLYG